MKILPQLEPYPTNLSFIRRPETPSGSVPNRSLKMQNLTKKCNFFIFMPILYLFLDSIVIQSFQNLFYLNFRVLFGWDGPLFSVMSIFLILHNSFCARPFFVLIFEHFTVSNFGILLQPFCSNSKYTFWLVRLFFDVEHYANSDISKPPFYDLFWEKSTLKLTKNKQKNINREISILP